MSEQPGAEAEAQPLDGRTARAVRTKQAVVDALLELLEEGDLRPTAPRIAERAGVSLRSVFQHFTDLDTLFRAAAERHFLRYADLHRTVPREGATDVRIRRFCSQRAELWEAIGPVRRAAELNEPFSDELGTLLDLSRQAYRTEIEWVFAAELDGLDAPDRRRVLDVLDTAAAMSAWTHQRYLLGHSVRRVVESMELAFRSVLAGAAGPGA